MRPNSAEARKDLSDEASSTIEEQLKPSMRELALLVMAVESNRPIGQLTDEQLSVMAHFVDPARASQAARTDSAMKIASVDEGFAGTDVFYEMVGLDQATIARLRSEKRKAATDAAITAMFGGGDADTASVGGGVQPQPEQA